MLMMWVVVGEVGGVRVVCRRTSLAERSSGLFEPGRRPPSAARRDIISPRFSAGIHPSNRQPLLAPPPIRSKSNPGPRTTSSSQAPQIKDDPDLAVFRHSTSGRSRKDLCLTTAFGRHGRMHSGPPAQTMISPSRAICSHTPTLPLIRSRAPLRSRRAYRSGDVCKQALRACHLTRLSTLG